MGVLSGYFTLHTIEEGIGYEVIYCVRNDMPNPFVAPKGEDRDGAVPSGWSAAPLGVNGSQKYRFISKRSKKEGHWSAWSDPVLDTRYGGQPQYVTNMYAANNSQTNPPGISEFSTKKPVLTNSNRVLWNYEYVQLDNGGSYVTPTHVLAVLGEKGDKGDTGGKGDKGDTGGTGADGNGILMIREFYKISSKASGESVNSGGWKEYSSYDSVPAPTPSERYLWNYEVIIMSKTSDHTVPPHVVGVYGEKGDTGGSGGPGPAGPPGQGHDYIFLAKNVQVAPNAPSGDNPGGGWTRNCPSVSASNLFIYESHRSSSGGRWGSWSSPRLKDRWAQDGGQGSKGDKGAKLRMRKWSAYTSYCQGAVGEDFYDVVEYNGHLYLCVSSHMAVSSDTPSTSSKWEPATNWTFIATSLLLAEKINASQIDADGIVAKNVTITGTVNASGGTIGGLNITGSSLSNKNFATHPKICLCDNLYNSWKMFQVDTSARSTFVEIEADTVNAVRISAGTGHKGLVIGKRGSGATFTALYIEDGGEISMNGNVGISRTITISGSKFTFTKGILTAFS